MLTIDGAKDLIDTYGPNRARWPAAQTPFIDALVKGDAELAKYLKRQQKIDKMLSSWKEADDGAEIEDFDGDPRDGEDEDEHDPSDGDDDADFVPSSKGGEVRAEDREDEEDRPQLSFDQRSMSDMDELFSNAIQALIEADQHSGKFNVFSRDRDQLTDIQHSPTQSMENIDNATMKAVGPLMKDLRRLIAARSQARRIPGKRSGRLHAPSLHRIRIGDDRVFSRKEEAPSLNTAISLVIDCSGSMSGSRIKLATETAYALGTVLNKLGIAFECIGFTENYYGSDPEWTQAAEDANEIHPIHRWMPLSMPKFKTFDERWTIPTMRRFAAVFDNSGMPQMGSTPEGCGMEFAAKRLLARSEERKIMMVMTDGEPAASQLTYNPGIYKRQSRDMVKAIEAAGVDLVGIGIQHAGPTGYYTNHLVIKTIEEMPKMLMGVLKKFIIG